MLCVNALDSHAGGDRDRYAVLSLGDVGGLCRGAKANLAGAHELVVAGVAIGVHRLKTEVLSGGGLVKRRNLPTTGVTGVHRRLPSTAANVLPRLAVVARLDQVPRHSAILAVGLARQVAHGLDGCWLGKLHGNPQLVKGCKGAPLGVIVRAGLAVEGKLDRPLVARPRMRAAGSGRDVLNRIVAGVVLGRKTGILRGRREVDREDGARGVALGLENDVHAVLECRQNGDGRVVQGPGINRCGEGARGVAAAGKRRRAHLLAVDGKALELSGGVCRKASLCLEELDLCHASAGLCLAPQRLVDVGEGEPHKGRERGIEVVGVGLHAAALGANGLLRGNRAPVLAVLGDLDLGGSGVGEAGRPRVVDKVDYGAAQALLRVVVEGNA